MLYLKKVARYFTRLLLWIIDDEYLKHAIDVSLTEILLRKRYNHNITKPVMSLTDKATTHTTTEWILSRTYCTDQLVDIYKNILDARKESVNFNRMIELMLEVKALKYSEGIGFTVVDIMRGPTKVVFNPILLYTYLNYDNVVKNTDPLSLQIFLQLKLYHELTHETMEYVFDNLGAPYHSDSTFYSFLYDLDLTYYFSVDTLQNIRRKKYKDAIYDTLVNYMKGCLPEYMVDKDTKDHHKLWEYMRRFVCDNSESLKLLDTKYSDLYDDTYHPERYNGGTYPYDNKYEAYYNSYYQNEEQEFIALYVEQYVERGLSPYDAPMTKYVEEFIVPELEAFIAGHPNHHLLSDSIVPLAS